VPLADPEVEGARTPMVSRSEILEPELVA
jgi:hypothetical protein